MNIQMMETIRKLNLDLLKLEDQKTALVNLENIMERALDSRHVFFAYLLGMAVIELRTIIKEGKKGTEPTPCGGHSTSEKFLRMMSRK